MQIDEKRWRIRAITDYACLLSLLRRDPLLEGIASPPFEFGCDNAVLPIRELCAKVSMDSVAYGDEYRVRPAGLPPKFPKDSPFLHHNDEKGAGLVEVNA